MEEEEEEEEEEDAGGGDDDDGKKEAWRGGVCLSVEVGQCTINQGQKRNYIS